MRGVAKRGTRYKKVSAVLRSLVKNKWLYIMLLPGIIYYIMFRIAPLFGLVIAFKKFQPFLGIWGSPWIGFENFRTFFSNYAFLQLLRNTLILAVYNIVFYFPLPIIVALLLNELRSRWYKRFVQTVTYIPHFFSWVVVSGIFYMLFTTEGGAINEMIYRLTGSKINFLASTSTLRPVVVGQQIWKDTGWGTIIFLAAITSIDPNLYEAASIDGANRWRKMRHITLPAISSTITILLILRMGTFLDSGFEQLFVLINPGNREVAEVFDTYVYEVGLKEGRFSYTTAVGMFKSVVSFLMVLLTNRLARFAGQEGVL